MLRQLTAKQFRELEHFEELEPSESLRHDWRTASIVTTIANVNRGPKQKAYDMKDFLLRFTDEEKKPKSHSEQVALIRTLAAALSVPE